jgi:3',5'-cyclic AMP phosphodiesterase CpdA
VYTAPGLQVPWYFVAGNHDWVGNVTGARRPRGAARAARQAHVCASRPTRLNARVARPRGAAELLLNGSDATGGRWVMPSTYYTFTLPVPGGDTVQFVMIDTETLTGGVNPVPAVMPELYYPPGPPGAKTPAAPAAGGAAPAAAARRRSLLGASGGGGRSERAGARAGRRARRRATAARGLAQSSEGDPGAASPLDPPVPPSWVPPPVDEAQWAWIEATLAAATGDWLIVVGHHPVWSVGEYGPTWALVERLRPLMEAAGVALYVCGHEHQMEHFRSEPHLTGVDYLVVGNGAYWNDTAPTDMEHARDVPYQSLQFSYMTGTGFAELRIAAGTPAAPSQLSATLYGSQAQQLYAFYKSNPRTVTGHTAGDLRSPPAPARLTRAQAHSVRLDVGAAALVLAALLAGMFCAATAARRQVMTPAAAVASRTAPRTRSVVDERMAAWDRGARGERAPLVRGGGSSPGDIPIGGRSRVLKANAAPL